MSYLLVANPTAQSGRAQQWIDQALNIMRRRSLDCELLHTEPESRTVGAVRDRIDRGGVDVVIYLGGDGTFHEVACGILEASSKPPMGMLPSGTANDQGRSFGIERGDLERNISVIAAGHITELDVGHLQRIGPHGCVEDETRFFDSVGWGIHPDILVTRNRHRDIANKIPIVRELFRDKAIYVTASIQKLFESYWSPVKFRAEITADGVEHVIDGLTDAIISATPIYAGHWVLDRRSEPDDGKFEFAPMQGRRDWASKGLRDLVVSPVWQEQLDAFGLTHAEGFSASSFEIELFRPEKVDIHAQVDGEEWGTGGKYRVKVLPNQLPLITPADFVPPWKP